MAPAFLCTLLISVQLTEVAAQATTVLGDNSLTADYKIRILQNELNQLKKSYEAMRQDMKQLADRITNSGKSYDYSLILCIHIWQDRY
jgi:methyl-accepting chemotaxis protein